MSRSVNRARGISRDCQYLPGVKSAAPRSGFALLPGSTEVGSYYVRRHRQPPLCRNCSGICKIRAAASAGFLTSRNAANTARDH